MNRLEKHVEYLFREHIKSPKTEEAKAEILGNLEAKVADMISGGMEENSAISSAIEGLKNVDWLQDENIGVYTNQFQLEYAQRVLLYFLVGWILTIPFGIVGSGVFLSFLLFIVTLGAGITYLVMGGKRNTPDFQKVVFMNFNNAKKRSKLIWLLWALFILVSMFSTLALRFGSNLWFHRSIHVDGPYQFAMIAVQFLLPLFTVLVPLCVGLAPSLILKYQVGEKNEN